MLQLLSTRTLFVFSKLKLQECSDPMHACGMIEGVWSAHHARVKMQPSIPGGREKSKMLRAPRGPVASGLIARSGSTLVVWLVAAGVTQTALAIVGMVEATAAAEENVSVTAKMHNVLMIVSHTRNEARAQLPPWIPQRTHREATSI